MGHVDVAMSHDWPTTVCYHGNIDELLKLKPHFREDVSICECVCMCACMCMCDVHVVELLLL